MYNSIIDAIETILLTITEIKAVYDTEVVTTTYYPYASITPLGHEESFKTLRDTERIYNFRIRIFANLVDTTIPSQKTIRTIADKVINKLGCTSNIKLNIGSYNYTKLTGGTFAFQQGEAPMYVFECTYKVSVLINRDTI